MKKVTIFDVNIKEVYLIPIKKWYCKEHGDKFNQGTYDGGMGYVDVLTVIRNDNSKITANKNNYIIFWD